MNQKKFRERIEPETKSPKHETVGEGKEEWEINSVNGLSGQL